jgi:hypothetical protein
VETYSQKRRRGRPRLSVFTPEYEAFVLSMFPEVKTKRGQQNLLYRQYAINALLRSPVPASWLFDAKKCEAGEPSPWCSSVLVELGRSLNPPWIVETAKILGSRRTPKNVRVVVAEIKRARQARTNDWTTKPLFVRLLDVAFQYQREHPDVSLARVEEAFDWAQGKVREMRSKQPPDVYEREQAEIDAETAAMDRFLEANSEKETKCSP